MRISPEVSEGGLNVLPVLDRRSRFRAERHRSVDALTRALLTEDSFVLRNEIDKLSRKTEQIFLGGVQALARAVEAKDAYLNGHSMRVADYSMAIARQLSFDDKQMKLISLGAQLHDIGKIGVSDQILNKTSSLTDDEYHHVMSHTVVGEQILKPFLSVSHPQVLAIVRSHHEWYDGSGLPDGLEGDNIPLVARVVAVADSFDAMTSTRSYRKARPIEYALKELRKARGTQLDPYIVDAFFKCLPALD